MRVRPATPDDVPAMMALERHAATAAHWSEADYARIFSPGGGGPRRVALVLEEETVAGFIVAHVFGPEWEIENVAVAGPARRRGLAARLLGELMDLARRQGASSVFLEVRESNAAARALYEKWAFVEAGRRRSYYCHPDEDAVLYSFSFPSQPPKAVDGG